MQKYIMTEIKVIIIILIQKFFTLKVLKRLIIKKKIYKILKNILVLLRFLFSYSFLLIIGIEQ